MQRRERGSRLLPEIQQLRKLDRRAYCLEQWCTSRAVENQGTLLLPIDEGESGDQPDAAWLAQPGIFILQAPLRLIAERSFVHLRGDGQAIRKA